MSGAEPLAAAPAFVPIQTCCTPAGRRMAGGAVTRGGGLESRAAGAMEGPRGGGRDWPAATSSVRHVFFPRLSAHARVENTADQGSFSASRPDVRSWRELVYVRYPKVQLIGRRQGPGLCVIPGHTPVEVGGARPVDNVPAKGRSFV
jgi:hypothetical protein